MNNHLKTIDPSQKNIPENAVIQKVASENNRLSQEEHEKAVKAFLISDSIASGIGKDFAFVEKIPQLIKEIIENKAWECLYISRGVVTPYYCCYNKSSNSENFRAFISAKRPNGLETTIETIDRLLEVEPEVQWMFRNFFNEPKEVERDDHGKYKSSPLGSDFLSDVMTDRQQRNIRAANRAGEAIPEIRELLDRGLIAIDVAAKLGRDIKDTNNLTAEEREYIDKRDLIGVRIRQYINTNTIPEDEDQEPAYSRKLNRYVKDLLGIKDRSKSVRMDNPKMAAKKLLEFYKGEKLKQLIEILQEGLQTNQTHTQPDQIEEEVKTNESTQQEEIVENESLSNEFDYQEVTVEINPKDEKNDQFNDDNKLLVVQNKSSTEELSQDKVNIANQQQSSSDNQAETDTNIIELTREQLARRLNVVTGTLQNAIGPKRIASFPEWTKNKDPDGIAWQRIRREDNIWYFSPVDNNHRIISRG